MNYLQVAFDRRGLTPKDAAKRDARLKYVTLYQQYHNMRSVGPKAALLYEKTLEIPRSELRPDLWLPDPE